MFWKHPRAIQGGLSQVIESRTARWIGNVGFSDELLPRAEWHVIGIWIIWV